MGRDFSLIRGVGTGVKGKWLALVACGLGLIATATAEYWEPASGKYVTLTGCQFVPSGADDGDSFLVQRGKDEFLFRLYAVDTPETTMSYPDRVAAQAQHFGITSEQAVKVGLAAERVTSRLLAGAFTVRTCWQDAKGNSRMPRYYAVVTLGDGRDLAEELAAAGLARVYGFTPTTPGFSLAKLQALEGKARAAHLGGYGLAKGGAVAEASASPASRLPPTMGARASGAASLAPAATAPTGKVNINTATAAELEAVPGIGPHYAKLIIEGRPYENLEAVLRVRGIGPKTFTRIAPYLSAAGR